MKFDFDKTVDRRNTNSYKWNVEDGEIPLWVADMDFETAPCIKEALFKRVQHGVFGYSVVPEKMLDSYSSWWKRRHGFEIKKEWLVPCTGVVPALSSCVRKLTCVGEKVLIQTPVYNIFFNSIVNNGRTVLESPLDFDGENYSINFQRLEKDLSDPQVSLMILCNPHNPCGKIWSKDELSRIGEICKKNGVTVVSDEIHCDIVRPNKNYVPFAAASKTCSEISITCIAPTKCFNLAGIQSAAVFSENKFLRHKIWRGLNTDEVAELNAFASDATIAAFDFGEEWLNQLNEYLFENRKFAEDFIEQNIPILKTINADATYLLWINIEKTKMDGIKFTKELRHDTGLFICDGNEYGKTGENFVRLNLACPKSILVEALNCLKKFVLTIF